MRLLRIYRPLITALLLIVTFSSVLHATPFKNINRENLGAADTSESTTGRAPTAFQLDHDAIVLERLDIPSAAAPISLVTFSNISRGSETNFAAIVSSHHSDLALQRHTLRI
jgi:hypothetical protein